MWQFLPPIGIAMMLVMGAAIRHRWLTMAATIILADCIGCATSNSYLWPEWQWAGCSICDLLTLWALGRRGDARSITMAALVGLDVTFYLAVGAAFALGDHHTQVLVLYRGWWATYYLAYAILLALGLMGSGGDRIGKSNPTDRSSRFRDRRDLVLHMAGREGMAAYRPVRPMAAAVVERETDAPMSTDR